VCQKNLKAQKKNFINTSKYTLDLGEFMVSMVNISG